MPEWLKPRDFHDIDGVEEWRVLMYGAHAHFRTGSFTVGVELAAAVGELAAAAGCEPAVDVRRSGVIVRLWTQAGEDDGLSRQDVELARQISAAARALSVPADPAAVQHVQVTIDSVDIAAVRPFWHAVLGYQDRGEEDLVDPYGRGPSIWFQQIDAPRKQRNRLHVDVSVPPDQAEARVAAAVAAGGHVVSDEHAPSWWVLGDADGNEVCVATWEGRD